MEDLPQLAIVTYYKHVVPKDELSSADKLIAIFCFANSMLTIVRMPIQFAWLTVNMGEEADSYMIDLACLLIIYSTITAVLFTCAFVVASPQLIIAALVVACSPCAIFVLGFAKVFCEAGSMGDVE